MSDITSLAAWQIAELIGKREISPVEVIEAHLARIRDLNPKLNAFVEVDSEGALRQARQAEAAIRQGVSLGPLHGLPISIKSSIDVAGIRCEAGTRLRGGNIPATDAPLVERLRRAGAIVLGVTNTPELLMAWETDNLLYGQTKNPWDLSRTAGGSSGGEAAAIASRCSAGGVGSDGGGSIRVPAHFCGICGLKPTPGRIPATGHYPPSVGPFALMGVVGPMARCTKDVSLLFEVMQGADPGDTSAAPVPVRWAGEPEWRKLRVGYFEDSGPIPVTEETRQAVRTAADCLRQAGVHVERFRPKGLEKARQLWWNWFGLTGGILLRRLTAGREDCLSPILREFLGWVGAEAPLTAESLLDTWIERDLLRGEIFRQMKEFSALVCPVAAIPAFRHGERMWDIDGKRVGYLDAWSFCEWFNLLGMPGAVVPMKRSPEGLPIGVQVVTRPWEDELALSLAALIEQQRGEFEAPNTDSLLALSPTT